LLNLTFANEQTRLLAQIQDLEGQLSEVLIVFAFGQPAHQDRD